MRWVFALAFCLIAVAAKASPPQPAWFVPPPPNAGIERSQVDMRNLGGREDITVTGHRAPTQRDPHGDETRDAQPFHSDAAAPTQRLTPSRDCSPAYQTVAGQAASGMDMLSMGSAGCN